MKKEIISSKKQNRDLISVQQIQERAYFIFERRQKLGWSGNELTDWQAAEKQLKDSQIFISRKKR